jgi:transcriptional regulator with XRE-family HTH domain
MTDFQLVGSLIRTTRLGRGLTLVDLANQVEKDGVKRPSTAKLCRMESGIHPVAIDVIPTLVSTLGIPARLLRPDLARLFEA